MNQQRQLCTKSSVEPPANKKALIVNATACPQDISYPTDLNLLNDGREKSEKLIDILYGKIKLADEQKVKPRTYREIARKEYLKVAQKKHKTSKEIRHALCKQLSYLNRNIKYIKSLLKCFDNIPLNRKQYKYLLVIQTLYEQQKFMYDNKIHSVEHRIVSIHQPHVRPIVRGKTNAYVEFGAKIQMSIMNGIIFLEDISWDAFNEGTRLISTVENYKRRFGYYPQKVFAEIAREVKGISDKMLSKELKDLEMNQLVKRTVHDTFPPTVAYSVTEHTATLNGVMQALRNWGMVHRKKIIGK